MKLERRAKIIELIGRYEIETQEELAERLQQAGYSVTQATISLLQEEANLYQKYVRVLQDGLISLEQAENLLVIKTISGMAMAVAAAIDKLEISGVVGTIAGDDTVMCAIRSVGEVAAVQMRIAELVHEDRQ